MAARGIDKFQHRLSLIGDLGDNTRIRIRPILLKSPSKNLRNLLNVRIALSDFCEIFRTLWRMRPDAILVFYVLDGYPIAILKHLLRCSVYTVATGGDINLRQNWTHILLRRMIYSRSDAIIAVSNELRSKILRESGRKALLISTGVNTSFFRRLEDRHSLREKWQLSRGEVVILTVSNLEVHKGVDVTIRATQVLRDQGFGNLMLLVVGEGSQRRQLQELVAELNLKENVLFLGERSRWELLELYNLARVFVLASYSEGLPFSLLEAMSCETPCIASDVGGIAQVIADGHTGFILDSVSPQELASKLAGALNLSPQQLAIIGRNARRTVVESHDMRMIVKQIVHIISSREVTQ